MKGETDKILAAIVTELRERHGCHTVVLYGSRAYGEHTDSSDYDVVGIRPSGPGVPAELHDARELPALDGAYLDAFILAESAAFDERPGAIRYRHGVVLAEKDGRGERLIEFASELFRKGPKKLDAVETKTLRTWVTKTVARIARGGSDDLEANYRRAWLLYELPEIYFKLRGRWYLGPKEGFAWLRENDAATHSLFELALSPSSSRGTLRMLAERVLSA